MPFMPAPKNFLFRLLLSLILANAALAAPEDESSTYRFGEWAFVMPRAITIEELTQGPYAWQPPLKGLEFLLYWGDGKERALALRFSGENAKDDMTLLRSRFSTDRLKGCQPRGTGRVRPQKKEKEGEISKVEPPEFPDDASIVFTGSERSLRRYGEILAFDLGTHRVQITRDSPVVRIGEWNSADFCRFELEPRQRDEQ